MDGVAQRPDHDPPKVTEAALRGGPDRVLLRRPAVRWEEALPFGDGIQGGMLWGNRIEERILLSRQGLWLPAADPQRERRPLAHLLPEVRRLLREGHARDAELLWHRAAKEAGWHYVYSDPCHPAGELRFRSGRDGLYHGWRRAIDCGRGFVEAAWWENDGARHFRKAFASRADQAIVVTLGADQPGRITGALTLGPVAFDAASVWLGTTFPTFDPEGWRGTEVPVRDLVQVRVETRDGFWHLRGDYTHGGGWGVVARCVHRGGSLRWDGPEASVEGCDAVHVLASVYAGDHRQADALRARLAELDSDPEALLGRHAAIHSELHARCQLSLGGEGEERTGEELLDAAADAPPAGALIERLHALGRYLSISSAGGLEPPHLQGIWTGTWRPPWFGNYTQDENLQMMHWLAEPGRLGELVRPLLRYLDRQLPDWRRNARELFDCGGVVAPLMQSGRDGRADCAEWHFYTAGAGWIAAQVWDRWLYGGDPRELRETVLPFLRAVGEFYRDFLVKFGDERLHALPSLSVENQPAGWPARTTIDSTMDIAVAREVLGNLAEALRQTGGDPGEIAAWQRMRALLPDYRINADGALAEWIPEGLTDHYEHRHLSHLYPLFPGREFSPERSPAWFEAARVALDRRRVLGLRSQTSWSHVHLGHAYARARSGTDAARCLQAVLRACALPNLLFAHNDRFGSGLAMGALGGETAWQLDASLGLVSLFYEMLLQSDEGSITVLPAPAPEWGTGRIGPLSTRCRVDVSLAWNVAGGVCEVRLAPVRGDGARQIHITPGPGWAGGGPITVPPAGCSVVLRSGVIRSG
jgi:alpha-L-fucosidase 2